MRAFDWRPLLDAQRVAYIERGANVKRGELNIRCPWCGNADPSFHMGINLETGWYSCWRNRGEHSGKSPVRLVMKLLHVPYYRAREVCGLGEDYVDPDGYDAAAARVMGREPLLGNRTGERKRDHLEFDRHFLPIVDDRVRTRRHWNYLYRRGFDDRDIPDLCARYGLMAAREGRWAQRLVIPYYLEGALVTWTARAIAPAHVRYLDLSIEEALVPAKETLYNHDCILDGGEGLVVCEGPLDALKLDYYARPCGVRAVGLSTNSLTEHQTYMLEQAVLRFRWIGVMMDAKTALGAVDSMRMKRSLMFLPEVRTLAVPAGRGDAGECLPAEVREWALQLTGAKA